MTNINKYKWRLARSKLGAPVAIFSLAGHKALVVKVVTHVLTWVFDVAIQGRF